MQENSQNYKPQYFNICSFFIKLFLLVLCGCLLVCCGQKDAKQVLPDKSPIIVSESAININTASASELEKLPHIGAKTAREIIKYRDNFGRFRKPEHLLLVRGISDERFREMRNFIRTE
jgi:competence ComEA-like helix-hairpin-helix protein